MHGKSWQRTHAGEGWDAGAILGSRSGLNTAEDTMANVAAKLAELVAL